MTPEERARATIAEIRDHAIFNVLSDRTWERYLATAIRAAVDAEQDRCVGIIEAARAGEIDRDWRSIISVMQTPGRSAADVIGADDPAEGDA